jgi:hypothetical protein
MTSTANSKQQPTALPSAPLERVYRFLDEEYFRGTLEHVVAVLDVKQNLLRINKGLYEKMDSREQDRVLKASTLYTYPET